MGDVKRYRAIGIDLPLVSEEDHDREIAARDARIAELEAELASWKAPSSGGESGRGVAGDSCGYGNECGRLG